MLDSLELNFTYTESYLGKVYTHELVPSGNLLEYCFSYTFNNEILFLKEI